MSLSVFQRELARMVSDPDHRRRVASEPETLNGLALDARESKRLAAFARDPGMRLNTVLYRANRLAPIFNAMPRTCAALGDDLGELLRAFWRSSELEDLQFPNEVARFASFLRRDGGSRLPAIRGLAALISLELAVFELLLLPRRRLRAACKPPGSSSMLHPLVRMVAVDLEPRAMIAVLHGDRALARCHEGSGGVLVDHREDPGALAALTPYEIATCDPVRGARNLPAGARTWLAERGLLVAAGRFPIA